MPFALVIIGLIMIVTGAKDTYRQFGKQLQGDFTGQDNFTYWLAAIGSVGALGYIDAFKVLSRSFMALILIAMVLRNGGVFDKFTQALNAGPIAPKPSTAPSIGSASPTGSQTPLGPIGDAVLNAGADTLAKTGADIGENARRNFETFMGSILPTLGKLFGISPAL